MDPWNTRAGKQLRAEAAAAFRQARRPCAACGQAIDYDAPAHTPDALDVGHKLSRKTHPHLALDRANLQPEHVRCNRSHGVHAIGPSMGEPTEDW